MKRSITTVLMMSCAAAMVAPFKPARMPSYPARRGFSAAMLAPPPCGACLRSPRRHPRARVAIAESGLPLIVLLTGFEQFNRGLYTSAAAEVADRLDVRVFTDRDIGGERLESALADADVFFASLVFDYDQVVWLTPRVERIPTRLIFESALELMSSTRVGTFTMAGGGPAGPPKPIKALLSRFSSGREEDRLAGARSPLPSRRVGLSRAASPSDTTYIPPQGTSRS